MRKVLSFVLVLALVLGSFSMAFAATPTDVVGTPSEEAVSVLMSLGVVNGYEDGTFKPNQVVTRAEMAKLVVAALGLEAYASATTSSYSDMAGAGWAQGYVSYATKLGIIKGYPDGTFKPSQTVSLVEASAMIVRALGYTDESLPGAWPANYMVKAKTLGVLDDVAGTAAEGCNRGDIAQMLYNALTLDIGYINSDGDWTPNSALTMYELLKAIANDEEVEGNPDNMLVRLGATFNKNAVIEGDEDSVISLRPYVGAYAATYTNKDDEIIAVVTDSVFLTGEFDGIDTFTVDDVDYTLAADAQDDLDDGDAYPFYNGIVDGYTYDTFTTDGALTYTLAVDLSSKKIKEVYSIALWEVTDAALFADADADDIDEDQVLFDFDFVLDDDDEIDLNAFELLGAASLSDIDEDNVVYVYADDNDEVRKIEVGTEIVEGEITKISSGGDYTIDGTKYSVSDASDLFGSVEGDVKDEVKAYLDYAGDIFEMEITEGTADDFAIVLETGDGSGSGITGYDPAIKLFLADGNDDTFDVDADSIDDVNIIDGDSWTGSWAGTGYSGYIVEYGLDEDGVVDSLTMPAAYYYDEDDITSKGYFASYKIASDAVIFTFDGDDYDDEDNYSVTTLDKVKGTDNVSADYIIDDGDIVAMLIYDFDAEDDVYGVVTDWSKTGSSSYEFEFLIDGVAKVYDATSTAYTDFGLDFEELYLLSFNASGDVNGLEAVSYNEYLSEPVRDGYKLDGWQLDETDLTLYKWVADDEVFVKGSLRDLDGAYDVYLYDTLDEDGVFDVVLYDIDGTWYL